MAINNAKIKGKFTVFYDFEIEFCNGINLLIGKNGVGKTQLLKLMYIFAVSQRGHSKDNPVDHSINMEIPAHTVQDSISSVFDVDIAYFDEHFSKARFSSSFDGLFFPSTIFIPSKEMLSHAKGLPSMKKKYGDNMPFDATLLDIIEKAQAWKLKETPTLAKSIIPSLEKVMDGKVEVKDDGSFWMKKTNGELLPFSLEAEGLKKLGLLWQLLVNESISRGCVVLWDEPETSINPDIMPVLVDAMLNMQRQGVQIIAATHSYHFARYFDILRKNDDRVHFYCLYKSNDDFTRYTQAVNFSALSPNPIDDAGERLYEAMIQKAMEAL